MKKAYVKPVFVAEEFEGTASVAACGYSSKNKFEVWEGVQVCHSPGHKIGQGNDNAPFKDYLEYATDGTTSSWDGYTVGGMDDNKGSYVFTSGLVECDFVWNSNGGSIGVWKQDNEDGSESLVSNTGIRKQLVSLGQAGIKWLQWTFMPFFRQNNSDCAPELGNATPFSG